MPLGLTWLDVLLIVALAMLLVQGHRRGLWVVLGNLVGLVGGAAIAFYALPEVAEFVTAPQWRWAALIATLVLLVAAGQYVGAAIGEAIRLRVNLPALRLVDRLLGALAAGLAGALVLWLVAFSIAASGSTAVTREVNRSQVITALDTVMPDSLLAWAARSRSAVADLDVLPELELPAPVPESDDGVRAAPAPAATPGLPSAASSPSDTATSAPSASATPEEPDDAAAASSSTAAAPSATTTAPASSTSTAAPSTPAASSASAAVVRLTGTAAQCNQVQSGSGVAVAPDRVLTNAHVVLGVDAPTVTDRARGVHAARIVHLDTAHDLAVLAVDDANLPVMPVGAELTGGASASVLGYPDGGPFASTPATVQAVGEVPLGDVLTGAASMVDVYTLAADIRHGYSGGPVVDTAGNLAGLVFARAPGSDAVGYALTADTIAPVVAAAPGMTATVPSGDCVPGG
ncbi:MarP family serine protease [Micrococcus luteus]|uniref:MarP family serine protease n=1 Tax=Micrococcus TaxID=1269 RepID=UPI0005CB89AA|nr:MULTISPECIES: MarP family serine protease [Micrococcus]MBM4623961.1 MarP family serine protease [Micrococcus sp. JV4]MBU8792704.1 MarP family serine protease [Micrococcus luteus]MCV7523124.1 MarP family serine protease [Micrococcus luteus]MCV7745082.1 MarP family serine protease [Micrococcus luteus]MCV7747552.1 MarP family serine protease [Micrococcus luteus]